MRYGIRYNPNKKMIEYLDIDEIEPNDILEIIEEKEIDDDMFNCKTSSFSSVAYEILYSYP